MEELDLGVKETKGLIQITKAIPYENHMIYIRQIKVKTGVLFEWLFNHEEKLYSSYILFTSEEELTKGQRNNATALLYAGAQASVDILIGKEPDEEAQEIAQKLNDSGVVN